MSDNGDYRSPHQAAISDVAHTFRTPLGLISGYAELLQLRDDPALRADALQQIEEAATRLLDVVDRLLATLDYESDGLAELFLERWQALERGGRLERGAPGK